MPSHVFIKKRKTRKALEFLICQLRKRLLVHLSPWDIQKQILRATRRLRVTFRISSNNEWIRNTVQSLVYIDLFLWLMGFKMTFLSKIWKWIAFSSFPTVPVFPEVSYRVSFDKWVAGALTLPRRTHSPVFFILTHMTACSSLKSYVN